MTEHTTCKGCSRVYDADYAPRYQDVAYCPDCGCPNVPVDEMFEYPPHPKL